MVMILGIAMAAKGKAVSCFFHRRFEASLGSLGLDGLCINRDPVYRIEYKCLVVDKGHLSLGTLYVFVYYPV